jgi:hypothetical protein
MKSAEHCLSCDVTMHQFHRIGYCEGKRSGQHFVKRDSERIEIASRINGAIHSPGLFEHHVIECSGDELRRFGRLALARKARSDTETHKSDLTCHGIHLNIDRLHILMNQLFSVQTSPVPLRGRRRGVRTASSSSALKGIDREFRRQGLRARASSGFPRFVALHEPPHLTS